jgi:hypothetical protein
MLRPAPVGKSAVVTIVSVAVLSASGAGCAGGPPPAPVPSAAAAVATVAGAPAPITVTATEIAAEMRRAGRTAREALNALVDFELLAGAAARSIAADDPDVLQARQSAMVQRLLERDLEPRLDRSAIPEPELRTLYTKARSVFVHPRLVEVAILSVYTGARMKDEPRARALAAARELEAAVRLRAPAGPEDLEALAKEPTWRERHVKYARIWQGLDEPFEAEVGRAVAALAHPTDTTPLITSESGYHIARYIAERPPENISFEQATPQLRDQIYERWRQAAFIRLTDELAGSHQIEAFPDLLSTE